MSKTDTTRSRYQPRTGERRDLEMADGKEGGAGDATSNFLPCALVAFIKSRSKIFDVIR